MLGRMFYEALKWLAAGGISLGITVVLLQFLNVLTYDMPMYAKAGDRMPTIHMLPPVKKKIAPDFRPKQEPIAEPKRKLKRTKNRPKPLTAPVISPLSDVAIKVDEELIPRELGITMIRMGDFDGRKIFTSGDLDSPLMALARVQPVYPIRAKKCRIQGFVTVRFVVTKTGSVDRISIVEADPVDIFDYTVRQCVSRWRFKPGTVGGVPVNTWAETTIMFELKNG